MRHSYVFTKLLSSFLDQQDDDLSLPSLLFDLCHCLCSVQGNVGRGDVGQPKPCYKTSYTIPQALFFLLLNIWQSWKSSDEGSSRRKEKVEGAGLCGSELYH